MLKPCQTHSTGESFVYVPVGPHSYKYRWKRLFFFHFALKKNIHLHNSHYVYKNRPYTQYSETWEHTDKTRWKRFNGVVSCWLYSLAQETAGTHKDRAPFLTGHPGVTGYLWVKENMVQVHVNQREYWKNTLELRNYGFHDYCTVSKRLSISDIFHIIHIFHIQKQRLFCGLTFD